MILYDFDFQNSIFIFKILILIFKNSILNIKIMILCCF